VVLYVGGADVVSLTLRYSYRNETNVDTLAWGKIAGLARAQRAEPRGPRDPNATLATLGIDAIAPDTSITVDDGQAATLFAYAVGFGIGAVVIGSALGYGLFPAVERRRGGKKS